MVKYLKICNSILEIINVNNRTIRFKVLTVKCIKVNSLIVILIIIFKTMYILMFMSNNNIINVLMVIYRMYNIGIRIYLKWMLMIKNRII